MRKERVLVMKKRKFLATLLIMSIFFINCNLYSVFAQYNEIKSIIANGTGKIKIILLQKILFKTRVMRIKIHQMK